MAKQIVDIPRELLWDYAEAPDDLFWRLQRLADFFPAYGTDRETVELLFENATGSNWKKASIS